MPYKDKEKQKEAQRRHYLENRQDYVDHLKSRRRRNKKYARDFKASKGCVECGENDPFCLDFHHRCGKDKNKTISMLISDAVSIENLQLEIDKCDVLCANCHRKYHANGSTVKFNSKQKWLRTYKKQICCEKCQESHYACLDFHHRKSDDKLFAVSNMLHMAGVSVKMLLEEIAKCDVWCANCHRKHHKP